MRGTRLIVVAAATAACATAGSPAAATPPGKGLQLRPATCDAQETVITASSGAPFWVGGQKYVIHTITFIFTPTGGEPQAVTKTFGTKNGQSGPPIHCSGSFTEPEGTATFDGIGVPTP